MRGRAALAHAGWQPQDLDLILLGAPPAPTTCLRHGPQSRRPLGQNPERWPSILDGGLHGFLFALTPRGPYLRLTATMRRVLVIALRPASGCWIDWA